MKILTTGLILLSTLIIWLTVDQYFFCPRFSFEEPQPFRGQNLYNPYQGIDSSAWRMCNFHAHSTAWKGLTNGNGTAQDIWDAYDSLGYAVHLVSDYQKIDRTHEYHSNFIPAYEHGFNIKKVHHLVLGDQVFWLDYLLPQILSNKQLLLNQLNQHEESLVIVNHPDMRNAIEYDDVKYLSNYRCMEVISPYSNAVAKWDSALSAGKPVFLVGNDDVHNIFNKRSVGRFCTVVNAQTPTRENVITALKTGSSYGMKIPEMEEEDFDQKIIRFKTKLPKVQSCKLENNTIQLVLDKTASEIIFHGQNGRELARINHARKANYVITESDQYVRPTVAYADGTMIYLNPIFRYNAAPFSSNMPTINQPKSSFLKILGTIILLLWGYLMYLASQGFWKPVVRNLPNWVPSPHQG